MDIKNELKMGKNIFDLPLRVCYYARVSTEHEEQATSIVNQIDYFINYIKKNSNWSLVDSYIDEGISGKAVYKREQFMQMISDGKDEKFDLILTKSVSRFARNTMDSIYYTNLLLDKGIGVYFLNDNINTFYADSEFRLTLMASIAQDELRKLSESVKFGLKQSINRGVVLGNNNILGFCKNKGKLVIVEDESIIVKNIFSMFKNGIYNYSKIARLINKMYNKKFNSSSIKRILTNYKYKGYYCGKKSEVVDYKCGKRKVIDKDKWVIYKDYNLVPPIINEDIWNQVNQIIVNKKNINSDIYKNKVFCKLHGLVKVKTKKYKNNLYRYYVCSNCFRISSMLLDRVCRDMNIKKVIISSKEVMKLELFLE